MTQAVGCRTNAGMIAPSGVRPFHWLCILSTPLIQWSLNRNLFVTPAGDWIDPWVYTGYFLSLPSHRLMFGDTYYATRLGWLLPGFVAHKLFSPLLANYVLHLSFLYVLLFAVYHVVGTTINRHAGMLAALVVGWNPMILAAVGWDYVDGAGIVFVVLSLMCLEKLSREPEHRWVWALSAGASMAAMIGSNLFLVVLWPVLALFLLMRVGLDRWRSAFSGLLVAAAGAGAVLVALAFVNTRLGGSWLFLTASFRETRELLTIPNVWRVAGYAWLMDATWLVLPTVAAVGSVATFVPPRRTGVSFAVAIQISLLLSIGLWLLLESRGLPVLHIFYYASYLFPFSLLALLLQGPLFGTGTDDRGKAFIEIGILALFVLAHWLVLSDANAFWYRATQYLHVSVPGDRLATGVCLATGLLAMCSWRFVRNRRLQWMLFGVLLAVSYFAAPRNWPSAHRGRNPEQFEQTVTAHRFIRESIGTERPRFWYHPTPITQVPFTALASTYLWGYVLVNQDFPRLTKEQAAELNAGMPLVFLVRSVQEAESARPVLAVFGFDYSVQVQKTFGNGEMSFVVVIANLVFNDTDAGRQRALAFREWQGQEGAVVERDSATSGGARSTIALPPNAYAWTAAPGARSDPSGQYVASLMLKGEGALTLRVTGLEQPWPRYNECPVDLTPAGRSLECAFTKPADRMGVEIALMNNSKARVVVSTWGVNTRKLRD